MAVGHVKALADGLLFTYEANALPTEAAGWIGGDTCDDACSDSIIDGHYVTVSVGGGDGSYNRTHIFHDGGDDPPPPESLWVEWRFRTNHPLPPTSFGCNVHFTADFGHTHNLVNMFSNAVISHSGDHFMLGLEPGQFHTHRFESPDGWTFSFAVDGTEYFSNADNDAVGLSFIQMLGSGGCALEYMPVVHEWDFVRFGTLASGEQIIATEPPGGFIDARQYASVDHFAVTFDSPAYAYVDEISVSVTGGSRPQVVKTWRRENDRPDTFEVVLDRPIPLPARTTFTFDDGVATNLVEFEYAPGDTDGDGDADLADAAALFNCFGDESMPAPCPVLDADRNNTIELTDYKWFHAMLLAP